MSILGICLTFGAIVAVVVIVRFFANPENYR